MLNKWHGKGWWLFQYKRRIFLTLDLLNDGHADMIGSTYELAFFCAAWSQHFVHNKANKPQLGWEDLIFNGVMSIIEESISTKYLLIEFSPCLNVQFALVCRVSNFNLCKKKKGNASSGCCMNLFFPPFTRTAQWIWLIVYSSLQLHMCQRYLFIFSLFASPHPYPLPPAEPPSLRRQTSRFCPTLSPSRVRWKGGCNDGCSHGRETRRQFIYVQRGSVSLEGSRCVCLPLYFHRPPPPPLAEIYKEQKIRRGREGGGLIYAEAEIERRT